MSNPSILELVRLPETGTVASPSISFGGGTDALTSSGTGIFGNEGGMSLSVGVASVVALTASATSLTGTLAVSGTMLSSNLSATVMKLGTVQILIHAGVPVDGIAGTGLGASKGSVCIDTTNADLYINANTDVSPTWKLVTRAV